MRSLAFVVALLLASPAPAADQFGDELLSAINAARQSELLTAVAPSETLAFTATITADWLGYANRRNKAFQFHAVNTAWLRKNYPKLLWDRIDATFPCGPPESLSPFNVARLCGWTGGVVYDIEAEAGRSTSPEAIVDGWARSGEQTPPQNHWMVLFDFVADFDVCGVASEPRGGGKQIVVAVFGVSNQE